VLYEGKPVGTPDAGAFWRVVSDYGVKALFTAPTAFRAIKKEEPDAALLARHDVSSLECLFLAGERLDPDTYAWATEKVGVPVVDNWWQTETGWPICANPRGLAPLPLKPAPAGVDGAICLRLPLPPGTLPTLWGDDDRYVAWYLSAFPGHYLTGDGGHVDEDGYLYVMGRTDDVINVAGHRLSTGTMEAVLAGHPAVAECAVVGVHDDIKGQVPRGTAPGRCRAGAAQDAVGQDPAAHDARDRRRARPGGPEHDRRPVGPRDAAPIPALVGPASGLHS
jgi:propionyl-CoA synthetase